MPLHDVCLLRSWWRKSWKVCMSQSLHPRTVPECSRYPEEDIGHHRTVRINQQLQAPDIALNHVGMAAKKRPIASLSLPLVRATNIHSPSGCRPAWLPYNCSIRGRAVSQSQCLSQVPSVLAGSERNIGSATATLSKRNTSGKLCDFLRWFWPCVSLPFSSLNMADGNRQHFWILTEGNCRRKVLFRQKKS